MCISHARLIGFPFSDTPSWVFEFSLCFGYLGRGEERAEERAESSLSYGGRGRYEQAHNSSTDRSIVIDRWELELH